MIENKKNVPKIRFEEFSGEWERVELSEIFTKVIKKNSDNKVTNVISNSAKYGLVRQLEYFQKDIANTDNTDKYYVIKNGDFVYNPRKSIEAPYGPICTYNVFDEGIVSPLYLCFRSKKDNNNEFFAHYFKSPHWHNFIYTNGDTGARHDRVSIKDKVFFEMPIPNPTLFEQQKIAAFLTTVDEKIETQKNIVESLEQQKKGFMQKIFNREIRFKDDNGNDFPIWEEKKLGDKSIVTMGQSPNSDSYNSTNGIPLVQGNSDIDTEKRRFNIKRFTDNPTKICDKNSIIVSVRAPVGFVCLASFKACIGRGVCEIKPKGIDRMYLFYFLISLEETWSKIAQGSTFSAINSKDVLNIDVPFPSLPEQQKIADFLSTFDEKIDLEKQILESWGTIKKGLLQQMFV